MEVKVLTKRTFTVFGKEGQGSASESGKWIPPLWQEAREHFEEITSFAKLKTDGNLAGYWGLMSDLAHTFAPWNGEGAYLAGCEVRDGQSAPQGWVKWVVPSYRYAVIKCEKDTYHDAFGYMRKVYMPKNNFSLIGAVHEYYSPQDTDGSLYLFFPVEKL